MKPLGCLAVATVFGGGIIVGSIALVYLQQKGIPAFVTQPGAQVDMREVVVQQLTGASELTTARLEMELVVPMTSDRLVGGVNLGTTSLLYIARGNVEAGIDLSQAQVMTSENQITVVMPAPVILGANLDPERSEVFAYDRGALGLGPDNAPELQTLAQQEAVQRLRDTACTEGLLVEANVRAEGVVQGLLTPLGQPVVVQATEPEQCN